MKIRKNYIENSTRPFILEWLVQTGINAFVCLIGIGTLIFICSSGNNTYHDILLYHLIFLGIVFILLVYEMFVSKIIISLKIDQKKQRIVSVYGAKISNIKVEHTLTRFDSSSCVCWFYPKQKDVDRYILYFTDTNNMIYKVRIAMSAKKQFKLLVKMKNGQAFNFCFFEKSRIFICFDEDDDSTYEEVDKRNRKRSLNNYI